MRPRQILALVTGLALAIPRPVLSDRPPSRPRPVAAATAPAAAAAVRPGARPDARRRAQQEDAVGARRRGLQDRPGRQHDDRRRPVHPGRRPDERYAVRPPEPVRLRRDHRPGRARPSTRPSTARCSSCCPARSPDTVYVAGDFTKINSKGPEPHPAAQRHHRPGGDVVQGALDQRRHPDDGPAAQQPAVHRWLLHQDRRGHPRTARHAQRDDRRARPVHGHHRVRTPQQQRVRRAGARRPPRVRRHRPPGTGWS